MGEIEIIEQEKVINKQELELEGVLLEEELKSILKICKETPKDSTHKFPLVIKFGVERKFVGDFDLTFDRLLELNFLSESYTIKLIDYERDREVVLFSKDNPMNGQSLFKLINLV